MKNAIGSALAIAQASKKIKEKGHCVTVHTNQRCEMGSACDLDIVTDILTRSGVGIAKRAWLDHEDFVSLASQMNVCVCASFEETYNYVAADCVTARTPVVGTKAIWWLPPSQQVNPDSTPELSAAIIGAIGSETETQLKSLISHDEVACGKLIETFEGFGVEKETDVTKVVAKE
jgi:hypothetical protein